MANQYGDVDQLKLAVDPPITDAFDDARLEKLLDAASRLVDDECGRWFYQTAAATELVVAPTDKRILDPRVDIVSLSAVDVDKDGDGTYEDAWTSTQYNLEPLDAGLRSRPFETLRVTSGNWFPTGTHARVKLTGVFGWPAVPPPVVEATLMLAVRLWKRRGSPLGVAGFGDMGPVYVRNTDPDIAHLLAPYRKWSTA